MLDIKIRIHGTPPILNYDIQIPGRRISFDNCSKHSLDALTDVVSDLVQSECHRRTRLEPSEGCDERVARISRTKRLYTKTINAIPHKTRVRARLRKDKKKGAA